jgi:hypothetical protein
MSQTSNGADFFVFASLMLGGFLFYFLPYFIGKTRGVQHTALLFLGNLIFGVSILGWFAALVYACVGASRAQQRDAARQVVYVLCDAATLPPTIEGRRQPTF